MLRTLLFVLFALPLLFGAHSNAYACINLYQQSAQLPLKNNKVDLYALLNAYHDDETPYWLHGFQLIQDQLQSEKDSLDRIGFRKLDYKGQSDYAVILLKMGQTDKALVIFTELYRSHPNEYNIMANYGTALEIAGQNKSAYEILEKAIAINPASHYNSEWIHLRILEQKMAARPDYTRVINLGIKNYADWITDKKYTFPQPADSLKQQIAYQLHERFGFAAQHDTIVGQLVLDFADIVAKQDSLEAAIPFYDVAVRYSPVLTDTVAARKEAIKQERKIVKDTFRWASVVWAIPMLVMVVVFVAWVRGRKA